MGSRVCMGESGSKDGSEETWACEGLITTLFPCKAGLLTEALVGPQIRARNPRMAIRRLGGLVTISRGYLGRTSVLHHQAPEGLATLWVQQVDESAGYSGMKLGRQLVQTQA